MPLANSWISLQDVGDSAGLKFSIAVELLGALGGNGGVFLATMPHTCRVLVQS